MSFKVGDKVSESVTITEKMVEQFAELSGDYNPVHMDEAYAKTTRFGRRIAHGMISAALISRVLAMKLGPGGIYLSQTMKFLNPVFIGDVLSIELTVIALREEKGIGTVETLVKKANGDVCVKGEAVIMRSGIV
ncbi:MAG: enoyl-CoA hydratase [Oligoflexia bacterium]|nr:MAG: enoyl-CoA hydratase [Oligoflexia bacterium]